MIPTSRRRYSRRLTVAACVALVAQLMLVTLSPIADAHLHVSGPVQLEPAGTHHLSHNPEQCPECIALQTLAIPGSPTYQLRESFARLDVPMPAPISGRMAIRFTPKTPRAPPVRLPVAL